MKTVDWYEPVWFEFCIMYKTESWWRHQTETFSALLAICADNSSVTGEFPAQRPVTRSFDVFFDLRLNKRLNKQWWGWWFETRSRPLWCHCNGGAPWDSLDFLVDRHLVCYKGLLFLLTSWLESLEFSLATNSYSWRNASLCIIQMQVL